MVARTVELAFVGITTIIIEIAEAIRICCERDLVDSMVQARGRQGPPGAARGHQKASEGARERQMPPRAARGRQNPRMNVVGNCDTCNDMQQII